MNPFRVFVVGTDTGVGKTQVASALLSLLADRGDHPAAFKPYETGVVRRNMPEDALALKAAAQTDDPMERICPHQFRAPLAPGVAAARLGREPSYRATIDAYRSFDGRSLVVEAAGGLRVPLDSHRDIIDLVAELRLPVILVARSGLGTLNHTALSLDALKRSGVRVRAVVMSRSRRERDPSERDNADIIARRHRARVIGPIPFVADDDRRRVVFRRFLRPLLSSR